MTTYWRDLDFRPAPPGWRVWLIWVDHRDPESVSYMDAFPLAGWIVQEATPSDNDFPDYDTESGNRRRRVIAATYSDGWLGAVEDADVWMILGPGQDDPTAEEQAKAIEDKRAILIARDAYRARLAEKKLREAAGKS